MSIDLPSVHCEFDSMANKGLKYQWWQCRHCGRQTYTSHEVEELTPNGGPYCTALVNQLRRDHWSLQQRVAEIEKAALAEEEG